jgi:hypothetical protein
VHANANKTVAANPETKTHLDADAMITLKWIRLEVLTAVVDICLLPASSWFLAWLTLRP